MKRRMMLGLGIVLLAVCRVSAADGLVGQVNDVTPLGEALGCWGDYDGDGDMDLFYSGYSDGWSGETTALYRNDGGGSFTNVANAQFTSLWGYNNRVNSFEPWGDYDNDGDLDLVLRKDQYTVYVYRNDGNDLFTEISSVPNVVGDEKPLWVDYDNDGDLDIHGQSMFARNDGDDTFVATEAFSQKWGWIRDWGDVDGDGDMDLFWFLADDDVHLYRNTGGCFEHAGLVSSLGVGFPQRGSVSVADYDGDEDLDVVMEGETPSNRVVSVMRNDNGTFVESGMNLSRISSGSFSVKWGDFDGDGYYDVLQSAGAGWTMASIYNGTDAFTNGPSAGELVYYSYGTVAWGDVDGDGDLDLAMGARNTTPCDELVVFHNTLAGANAVPGAPSALRILSYDYETGYAQFRWDAATDAESPSGLLTYNIQAGTTSGGFDLRSGEADPVTGQRRIAEQGIAGSSCTALLRVSPGTTCYWRVQGIDPSLQGGPWSTEHSFSSTNFVGVFTHDPAHLTDTSVELSVTVAAGDNPVTAKRMLWSTNAVPTLGNAENQLDGGTGPGTMEMSLTNLVMETTYYVRGYATDGSIPVYGAIKSFTPSYIEEVSGILFDAGDFGDAAWGDYDNDGDLDFVVCGAEPTRVYRNDSGTFTNVANLGWVDDGFAAWGDYDADGDLDLALVSGLVDSKTNFYLYRNEGADTFADTGINLGNTGNTAFGRPAWVDMDNDGDLDLTLVGGRNGFAPKYMGFLRNEGTEVFTEITAEFPQLVHAAQGWADIDGDGDFDWGAGGDGMFKLYTNGWGHFTEVDVTLAKEALEKCSIAWGDYDGDGDPDLYAHGVDSETNSYLYLNEFSEGGSLSLVWTMPGDYYFGDSRWGDLDNDGDLDLIATDSSETHLFRNQGSIPFVDLTNSLSAVGAETAAWGDYDNDGDLDILCTHRSDDGRLYRNLVGGGITNTVPTEPDGLAVSIDGTVVTFSWNAATDAQTLSSGLTYNLRIGTASGDDDVMPAMADLTTGYRRVPARGNVEQSRSWRIGGLAGGQTYYWSVQAVDNAFAGGAWAAEGSFPMPICTRHVSTNSPTPGAGYGTWETAAHTIQDAVDVCGDGETVLVAGGVYDTGGRVAPGSTLTNRVMVDRAVTLQGIDDPAGTVIVGAADPNTTNGPAAVRCVRLVDGATLSGFTLTNGHTLVTGESNRERGGGGVLLYYGGGVSNCIIARCSASVYGGGVNLYHGGEIRQCEVRGNHCDYKGGGMIVQGGSVFNSLIIDNSADHDGGGIILWNSGLVEACEIRNNRADGVDRDGGGIYVNSGGTVRNCLIAGNEASDGIGGGNQGGGIMVKGVDLGPRIESCTIVNNRAETGGGMYTYFGTNINCILYGNEATASLNNWSNPDNTGVYLYTCTTPITGLTGGAGCIDANPHFANATAGDYRLQPASPCIDAGTNQAWMAGAVDLNGNARIIHGTIDMGAYEYTGFITDSDGDTFTDYEEYVADTSATDSNDWFHIDSISNSTVFFNSSDDRLYTLLSSTNLVSGQWSEVSTQMGGGGPHSLSGTNNVPAEYFKLEVQLP